jgi:hypothetical protein
MSTRHTNRSLALDVRHKSWPTRKDSQIMGRIFFALIVYPAVKLAELEGYLQDKTNEHNYGEQE